MTKLNYYNSTFFSHSFFFKYSKLVRLLQFRGDLSFYFHFYKNKFFFMKKFFFIKKMNYRLLPPVNFQTDILLLKLPDNPTFLKATFRSLLKLYVRNFTVLTKKINYSFEKTLAGSPLKLLKFRHKNTNYSFLIKFTAATLTIRKLQTWRPFSRLFTPVWGFLLLIKYNVLTKQKSVIKLRKKFSLFNQISGGLFYKNIKQYFKFDNFARTLNYNYAISKKPTQGLMPRQSFRLRKRHHAFNYIKKIYFKNQLPRTIQNQRNYFKIFLQLKFKYQHRLTKFIFKFKRYSATAFIKINFFSLKNILLMSNLIILKNELNFFIQNNYIFLNGRGVSNVTYQLLKNDIILCFLSWPLLIYLKLLYLKVFKYKFLLNAFFYKFIHHAKKKRDVNYWFSKYQNLIKDTPNFLEVDFLTLSIILVYEPNLGTLLTYNKSETLPLASLFMLNWKFII